MFTGREKHKQSGLQFSNNILYPPGQLFLMYMNILGEGHHLCKTIDLTLSAFIVLSKDEKK